MSSPLVQLLREHLLATALQGEAPEQLTGHTPLQTSGVLDSLAVMQLVTFIEQRCGIELGAMDTGVDTFDTLEQMAGVIARKQRSNAVSA